MMRPRIADMVTIASRLTDTPESKIVSGRRYLHLCAIRHAIYLTAREWGYSYPVIGRAIGGRDHSTVINSIEMPRRLSAHVRDFDAFCEQVSYWSDQLPPFVSETDWKPPQRFKPLIGEKARAAAARKVVRPKPRRIEIDYDMINVAAARASMKRGFDQLMAALARAA